MKYPIVRLRLDFLSPYSVGPGKIALLECIDRTGSLSQAARELDMSYRRPWLLLDSVNVSFRERVVVTAIGGTGGGGAQLTQFGRRLITHYRRFERDTQARALRAFKTITRETRRQPPGARTVPVTRLSGR